MNSKRKIEIFSAGCPACEETVAVVEGLACPSCEIEVLDMHQADVAMRAAQYGIRRVPSVVIDGERADCCTGNGVDRASLCSAGMGVPLS